MYKKIYQFNEDYKVIKIWNSIYACVKTKQYTELAIKMAIKNNTIYEIVIGIITRIGAR